MVVSFPGTKVHGNETSIIREFHVVMLYCRSVYTFVVAKFRLSGRQGVYRVGQKLHTTHGHHSELADRRHSQATQRYERIAANATTTFSGFEVRPYIQLHGF